MRRSILALLILLLIISCWLGFPPIHKAAAQSNAWIPGLYVGWVYFLAKTDYQYSLNQEGISVSQTAVLYHQVHGDLECNTDSNGVGACSGTFPMDKILGSNGTLTSKDCNATWNESIRALGVDNMPGLAPLIHSSIAGGFSVPFIPQSGPAQFDVNVKASGSRTCQSLQRSGQTDIGIKNWPSLDFHVESHTTYFTGGSCSMNGFPRQMDVNHSHTEVTIDECRWMMFYFDPYATLPQK